MLNQKQYLFLVKHFSITTKSRIRILKFGNGVCVTAKRNATQSRATRKTGDSTDGYKPLMLGQRLKALAFALLQPLCF